MLHLLLFVKMAAEEANLLEMKAEAEETDEDVELLSREVGLISQAALIQCFNSYAD